MPRGHSIMIFRHERNCKNDIVNIGFPRMLQQMTITLYVGYYFFFNVSGHGEKRFRLFQSLS